MDIPVLREVLFEAPPCDLFTTPLWMDEGVEAVKKMIATGKQVEIAEEQHRLMKEELTRRVRNGGGGCPLLSSVDSIRSFPAQESRA